MIRNLKRRLILFLIGLGVAGCGATPPIPITAKCTETAGTVPGTFIWNCPLPDGKTMSFTTAEQYAGQVQVEVSKP